MPASAMRPETVVDPVARRARESGAADWSGPHHDHASATFEDPLKFLHRALRILKIEVGSGIQPVVVVERPVVVHPFVECVKRHVRRLDITDQCFFHADTQGGKDQCRLDVLRVEHGYTRDRIAVTGIDWFKFSERGANIVARAFAAEVIVE